MRGNGSKYVDVFFERVMDWRCFGFFAVTRLALEGICCKKPEEGGWVVEIVFAD